MDPKISPNGIWGSRQGPSVEDAPCNWCGIIVWMGQQVVHVVGDNGTNQPIMCSLMGHHVIPEVGPTAARCFNRTQTDWEMKEHKYGFGKMSTLM